MSGIAKGLGRVLGLGKSGAERRQGDFTPTSFTSGGLSGRFDKKSNTFNITRSDELNQGLTDIVSGFRRRGEELGQLRGEVTDAVTGFTRSRINRLRSLKEASVGNVRAELQKRRVAGSKFGMGQVASTELAFAELEDEIASEGALTELGLEREFIMDETQAGIDAASALVGQFNLEAGLAAGVATSATNAIQANLDAQARAAESRRDRNSGIIGTMLGFALG